MIYFILFSIELLWPQKNTPTLSWYSVLPKKKKILLLVKNKNIGIKNDSGKIRAFFSFWGCFELIN
jgi:hypothetical protein